MVFVLIHGSFGNPNENWLPELKTDLEAQGQKVLVPQLPVDDWGEMVKTGPEKPLAHQNLTNWIQTFEKEVLSQLPKNEKVIFVGHSLGPLFILHLIDKFNITCDCAIFVSPFLDKLEKWEFNHANRTFYKADFVFEKLKKFLPVSYVLYSDNDPFVSKNHSLLFAKALDSSTILVRRAGHMNAKVNLNEFPLVRDLCYSRLDLSLYQQFLETHKKRTAQQYITEGKNRGVIKLKPEDVVSEGIFHFRHMDQDGFCTLFTGIQN
jgi:predicted alpha/beta hydrolase family esterase